MYKDLVNHCITCILINENTGCFAHHTFDQCRKKKESFMGKLQYFSLSQFYPTLSLLQKATSFFLIVFSHLLSGSPLFCRRTSRCLSLGVWHSALKRLTQHILHHLLPPLHLEGSSYNKPLTYLQATSFSITRVYKLIAGLFWNLKTSKLKWRCSSRALIH